MSWTYGQFTSRLRKAGWESIGNGCYRHKKTKAKFYALSWTRWRKEKYGNGDAWYPFGLDEELPIDAPF